MRWQQKSSPGVSLERPRLEGNRYSLGMVQQQRIIISYRDRCFHLFRLSKVSGAVYLLFTCCSTRLAVVVWGGYIHSTCFLCRLDLDEEKPPQRKRFFNLNGSFHSSFESLRRLLCGALPLGGAAEPVRNLAFPTNYGYPPFWGQIDKLEPEDTAHGVGQAVAADTFFG